MYYTSKNYSQNIHARGFTTLELITVVIILAVVLIFTIRPFQSFRDKHLIDATSEQVIASLFEARTNTLASRHAASFGVHFETNKVVLFMGDFYNPSGGTNEYVSFPQHVIISDISLNDGGQDVVFERLTGEARAYGTITLSLTHNASTTRTITIESGGTMTTQ